ncbi:MAG: hypothetical protein RBS80_29020 [Thermoguttaceae bacterium]|jgi:hypothetical protein|nr:hypothetical protein [Thermoguttaceae bacterium]
MMMWSGRRWWRFAAIGVLVFTVPALTGCGGSHPVYPVHGQIVYEDGSPATELAGGTVTFESVDHQATAAQTGVASWGVVQSDGTFTLGTFKPADGAVPGKHRVAISPAPDMIEGVMTEPPISLKYATVENSGLEAEVTRGRNNIVLTIERK